MNDVSGHRKIGKKNIGFIACSEMGPIKFRSENRVLHATTIDKTAHFGGPQKSKTSLNKNNVCLQIPVWITRIVERSSTCEFMQHMPKAKSRTCYKHNCFYG